MTASPHILPPPSTAPPFPDPSLPTQYDAADGIWRRQPGPSRQDGADSVGKVPVGGVQTRAGYPEEQQQGGETLPGHGSARLVFQLRFVAVQTVAGSVMA